MKPASRPAIFKGRHSDPQLILCAVRGYLQSSLPFREAAARLRARGLQADHTTLWRWVQRYGLELKAQPRRPLPPDQTSWHVDETTVRVKGRWCYLYRALDATGTPIDFVLSEVRAAAAATRLFRTALTDPSATAAGLHHAGRGSRRRRRAAEATDRPPAAV